MKEAYHSKIVPHKWQSFFYFLLKIYNYEAVIMFIFCTIQVKVTSQPYSICDF